MITDTEINLYRESGLMALAWVGAALCCAIVAIFVTVAAVVATKPICSFEPMPRGITWQDFDR